MIEEKNMSEQRKIIHDDNNGLDYVLVGDYYRETEESESYGMGATV